MTRISALQGVLFSLLPFAAAAAPSFKSAPASEKSGGDGSGGWADFVPVEFDTEGAPPWVQTGLDFLANNYGYIGVVAVLLMLFLFARGSGGSRTGAAEAGPDDDDFFEPGDADSYGGGTRR